MKDRFRLFQIILYPDTDTYDYNECLRNLKSFKKWAFILHDKDLKNEDKEDLKKKHIHFLLHLDNAMTINALSNKINVPSNYIENVRNERSCVRYLIHADEENKYQYKIEDIKVSRSYERYVKKCFDDLETEEEIIKNIFTFINKICNNNFNEYCENLYLLVNYVNKNAYDSIYKRYRYEIQDFLKSKINSKIQINNKKNKISNLSIDNYT